MKKITICLLTALLSLFAALSFCSCRGEVATEGVVTVVLSPASGEREVYAVALSENMTGEGFFAVLNALRDKNGVTYVADASGYLTQVGPVLQDESAGAYVGIFTSVEADADTSGWLSPVTYNGMTLMPAKCGAADMTVTDGAVIYVGILSW